MQKVQRSWVLFKTAVCVIAQHKKLLIFPVLSFILTGFIVLFCLVPVTMIKTGFRYDQFEHWKAVGQTFFATKAVVASAGESAKDANQLVLKPVGFVLAGSFYFLCMFLSTFFNVAFFHQILNALKGNQVSLAGGLKFAISKLPSILLWTAFAGAIGLLIKILEERVGLFGRIILRLIGTAWSVASVFAIPVLIVEPGKNPFSILRQSALTLRKTWGESLIGYAGMQLSGTLVFICSLLGLMGAIFAAAALHSVWIMVVAGVGWLLGMVAFGYLSSVASQVYRGALFVYASEGVVPEPFNQELLDMAWKVKRTSDFQG